VGADGSIDISRRNTRIKEAQYLGGLNRGIVNWSVALFLISELTGRFVQV
jgi:hypothetical protein